MAWLGNRVILGEYAVGVILPTLFGLLTLQPGPKGLAASGWQLVLGLWLVAIGINYIPLLIYAILISRAGTATEEGKAELAYARQYGIQQVIILVPFLVPFLAILQESRKSRT